MILKYIITDLSENNIKYKQIFMCVPSKILDIKTVYINILMYKLTQYHVKTFSKTFFLYPECVTTMKGTPYRTVTSDYEMAQICLLLS